MARKNANAVVESTVNAVETATKRQAVLLAEMIKSDLGYVSAELPTDENGAEMIRIKGEDGEIIDARFTGTVEELEALKNVGTITGFDKQSKVIQCYYISRCASLARNNGFKSVGEFLSLQFDGLDKSTLTQYCKIGEKFVCKDENGVIKFRYEWCKGVSVTNLNQLLGLFNKCENNADFETKYIETGLIHPRSTLSVLKDEIKAINNGGNAESNSSSSSSTENEAPVLTVETAIAFLIKEMPENADISLTWEDANGDYMDASVPALLEAISEWFHSEEDVAYNVLSKVNEDETDSEEQ